MSGVNNQIYYKGSVACTYAIYAKGDRSTVLASGSYTGNEENPSFDFSFESSKSYDVILTVTEASSENISVLIDSSSDYGGED